MAELRKEQGGNAFSRFEAENKAIRAREKSKSEKKCIAPAGSESEAELFNAENGMTVHAGERLEDLEYRGLKIIQSETGYRFTSDSVLLAGLISAKSSDRVVDLGSGSGVVAILLAARTGAEVAGVELQPALADMAKRSVAFNGMEDRVSIVAADVKTAHLFLGAGRFDVAVANPPYYRAVTRNSDKIEESGFSEKEIAKFDRFGTLRDFAAAAKRLLKFGGRFYILCKADRLSALFDALKANGLEPKRLIPVQPKPDRNVDVAVVEAVKGGKEGLIFEPPLIVLDEEGNMTERARRIYHK